jgi:hypothetical protein
MSRIEIDAPSTVTGGAGGPPTGVASGELAGNYPGPTVTATHSGSPHHAEDHALGGAHHSGAITSAQHGSLASGDLHGEYVQESLFTTPGDIIYFNGSALARLPVGANGQVLMVDTSLGGKIKYGTPAGGGGVTDHASLTGVSIDQHHPQAHGHSSHTGIGANDHHPQAHALSGTDHSGAISSAQHGSLASGDLHPEYVQEAVLTAAGDLFYRNGSGVIVRLPLGTNGQVLGIDTSLSGKLKWIDPVAPGSGAANTNSFITASAEAGLTNETPLANVQISQLRDLATTQVVHGLGNDTGDDTAAFQAAVDALPNVGGTVLVPVGRFRCLGTILISGKGGIVFRGMGGRSQGAAGSVICGRTPGATLIRSEQGGDPVGTHSGPMFENIRFEDETVDDLTTSGVSAAYASGTITFTKSGHPFQVGDIIFTNRHTGANADYHALKVTITARTSTTFAGVHANPGSPSSPADLSVSLETLPDTSMVLLQIHQQTRWFVNRCAFFGGANGLQMDTTDNRDVSWGKVEQTTFEFNGVGLKVAGNGGQSVVVSGGNLLLKSGQIGFQGPNPQTNDDIAHFRAYGMKFDTQNCSGDGHMGFDLGNASYCQIGPGISFEVEGNGTGIKLGGTASASGYIEGVNFQHNETKEGIGILLTGTSGNPIKGVTIGPCQWGGTGWSEAIHIGPNTDSVKVMGGNVSSADTAVVIDNATDVTGTLVDGLSLLDGGSNLYSKPAGSDAVFVNCKTPTGWVGLNAQTFGRLAASATKTNDGTFSNLTGMSVAVGPNEVWEIETTLFYNTNSIADLQVRFNAIPSGGTLTYALVGQDPSASTVGISDFTRTSGNAAKALGGNGPGGAPGTLDLGAVLRGLYRGGANGGTLQLQWAQNLANAGQSTIYANSYIVARRLA